MNMTNVLLKFCTTLCLIAGLAAFGAGCGDDNGDGGDDCPTGQVKASINDGPEQCYETCGEASECSEAGATCNSGVCVGGGGNNGADAGADAGDDAGTDDDTGGTTTPGTDSCAEVIQCFFSCSQNDPGCPDACVADGTDDAQTQFGAVESCIQTNCSTGVTIECIQTNCSEVIDTCVDCTGDTTVDLAVGFGFQCTQQCTADSDCPSGQNCEDPILVSDAPSLCAHDMTGLSDTCTDDADCPAPDNPNGQSQCATQTQSGDTIDGGYCITGGCNSESPYGLESGCGLDGYCFSQGAQSACSLLCNTQEDCPRGTEDEFACNIIEERDNGQLLGTCGFACGSDADCAGQGFQGRCHEKGYCEYPCDPSDPADSCVADQNGTCEGTGTDGFCVFEPSDGGGDAGPDAGGDAGSDAGTDAGSDIGTDAGSDIGTDAGSDIGTDTDAG
jgi:hypothetical protein